MHHIWALGLVTRQVAGPMRRWMLPTTSTTRQPHRGCPASTSASARASAAAAASAEGHDDGEGEDGGVAA
jgi:hypothetical protein